MRPPLEVADIFRAAGPVWRAVHAGHISLAQLKVMSVIEYLQFRASSETMLTIAADRHHLGARIGITAVLHTWGSAMTHHPHIHMIVPGGGLSLGGTQIGSA